MDNEPASITRNMSHLSRLTQSGEPKTLERRAKIIALIEDMANHADERATSPSTPLRTAEDWGELATEARYRLECIERDTWAWA